MKKIFKKENIKKIALIVLLFVFVGIFTPVKSIGWQSSILTRPFTNTIVAIMDGINGIVTFVIQDPSYSVETFQYSYQSDDSGNNSFIKVITGLTEAITDAFVSPEQIFQGKRVPISNINIFEVDSATGKLSQLGPTGLIKVIKGTVQQLYIFIRNISAIVMLGALIYVGIMVILSNNNPQTQSQWKQKVVFWLKGLILVMFIHVIMIGLFYFTDLLKKVLDFTATSGDSLLWSIKKQYMKPHIFDGEGLIIEAILYAFASYTMWVFAIAYFKRFMYMMVMIIIAPIFGALYGTGNFGRQRFKHWMKEFLAGLLVQPFHMLIFYILFYIPLSLEQSGSIGGLVDIGSNSFVEIYALMSIMMIRPIEKFVRGLFGFSGTAMDNVASFESGKKTLDAGIKTVVGVVKTVAGVVATVATGGAAAGAMMGGAGAGATAGKAAGSLGKMFGGKGLPGGPGGPGGSGAPGSSLTNGMPEGTKNGMNQFGDVVSTDDPTKLVDAEGNSEMLDTMRQNQQQFPQNPANAGEFQNSTFENPQLTMDPDALAQALSASKGETNPNPNSFALPPKGASSYWDNPDNGGEDKDNGNDNDNEVKFVEAQTDETPGLVADAVYDRDGNLIAQKNENGELLEVNPDEIADGLKDAIDGEKVGEEINDALDGKKFAEEVSDEIEGENTTDDNSKALATGKNVEVANLDVGSQNVKDEKNETGALDANTLLIKGNNVLMGANNVAQLNNPQGANMPPVNGNNGGGNTEINKIEGTEIKQIGPPNKLDENEVMAALGMQDDQENQANFANNNRNILEDMKNALTSPDAMKNYSETMGSMKEFSESLYATGGSGDSQTLKGLFDKQIENRKNKIDNKFVNNQGNIQAVIQERGLTDQVDDKGKVIKSKEDQAKEFLKNATPFAEKGYTDIKVISALMDKTNSGSTVNEAIKSRLGDSIKGALSGAKTKQEAVKQANNIKTFYNNTNNVSAISQSVQQRMGVQPKDMNNPEIRKQVQEAVRAEFEKGGAFIAQGIAKDAAKLIDLNRLGDEVAKRVKISSPQAKTQTVAQLDKMVQDAINKGMKDIKIPVKPGSSEKTTKELEKILNNELKIRLDISGGASSRGRGSKANTVVVDGQQPKSAPKTKPNKALNSGTEDSSKK